MTTLQEQHIQSSERNHLLYADESNDEALSSVHLVVLIKSKLSAFYAYLDICQTKMLEIVDNRAALNFHIS